MPRRERYPYFAPPPPAGGVDPACPDAMLNLPWLKAGSAGGEVKKEWAKDEPLTRAQGGSLPRFSCEEFVQYETHFHAGSTMTALGTLAWVSNDLSNPRFLLQAEQIEKLARKSFTKDGGDDPDFAKPGVTPDFYERHPVEFPASWPEKYALPVVVRDLSKPAQRLRLLALDEFVLAFWKTVDRVKNWGRLAARALAEDPEDAQKQQAVERVETLLAQARALHNNVPLCFIYANSDAEAVFSSLPEALTPALDPRRR